MTEQTELIEDTYDLDGFEEELEQAQRGVMKHTLLESWLAVLSNVDMEKSQPISMMQAMQATSTHRSLTLEQLPLFFAHYYELLQGAYEVVGFEIESDPGCLNRLGDPNDPEREEEVDAIGNKAHYLNIIIGWNRLLQEFEKGWGVLQVDAEEKLAAYIDAKRAAEVDLQGRAELDWTIVRPSVITDEEPTGRVTLSEGPVGERGPVTRSDVAALVVELLDAPGTAGRTMNVVDGATPILDAVRALGG